MGSFWARTSLKYTRMWTKYFCLRVSQLSLQEEIPSWACLIYFFFTVACLWVNVLFQWETRPKLMSSTISQLKTFNFLSFLGIFLVPLTFIFVLNWNFKHYSLCFPVNILFSSSSWLQISETEYWIGIRDVRTLLQLRAKLVINSNYLTNKEA